MYCSIKLINLMSKEEINIDSDVQDNGILCTKFNDNQPKGEYSKIKGVKQIGQSVNYSSLTIRDLSLEGIIIGKNRLQVETLRKQLVTTLNPLNDVLLKYTDDYIEKELIVRASSVPIFSNEINSENLLSFLVSFEANYPLWESQKENIINIETWESNFEFEFELTSTGIEFARKGANEIKIFNDGQIEAPLEFYFQAPALNPKIMLNNKDFIKVNKHINNGEVLYICTAYGNKRVEIIKENGTRENAYGYIDIFSKFFKLPVGNSIISYATEGDFLAQSVILKYKNQYLSL